MRKRIRARALPASLALLAFAAMAAMPGVAGAHDTVVVTQSIQAAVDAAPAGGTVVVPPGTYRESVHVDKPITIVGSRDAVIDAGGQRNGITVGNGDFGLDADGNRTCPPVELADVSVEGLTIRDATENGIQLLGVDGFLVSGGAFLGNDSAGLLLACSSGGRVADVRVAGARHAGVFVEDDTAMRISGVAATGNTVGVAVENSDDVLVRDNQTTGNSVGIGVILGVNHPRPQQRRVTVERNLVSANNLPNPIPPDGSDAAGFLPAGSGILQVGGEDILVRGNDAGRNDTFGVALLANPLASQLDPRVVGFPTGTRVVGNTVLGNGADPDLARNLGFSGDIVYDESGPPGSNCFADNRARTTMPSDLLQRYACPA